MKERVGGPQHIPVRGGLQGLARQVLKKNCEIGVGFSFAALSVFRLRRAEAASAVWIPHSLPDIRSLSNRRGRGGEVVDVNGNLVEREKGDEFGIETKLRPDRLSISTSISASISTSIIASIFTSISARRITLNPGVGCAPSCWPIFGFRNLLGARRGAEGSFLCSPSSRFSGTGGGLGSLPRASRASWGGRQRRCALPKPAP